MEMAALYPLQKINLSFNDQEFFYLLTPTCLRWRQAYYDLSCFK